MDQRFEKYLPNATHVFSYLPGSVRTKRHGGYRQFKFSGTWGDNGISLRIPVKQLHAKAYVSQRTNKGGFAYKIPKGGITGKEAALLPVGGSIPRVVGSENTENSASFGYVADARGGYAPLLEINRNDASLQTAGYRQDMNLPGPTAIGGIEDGGNPAFRRNIPGDAGSYIDSRRPSVVSSVTSRSGPDIPPMETTQMYDQPITVIPEQPRPELALPDVPEGSLMSVETVDGGRNKNNDEYIMHLLSNNLPPLNPREAAYALKYYNQEYDPKSRQWQEVDQADKKLIAKWNKLKKPIS